MLFYIIESVCITVHVQNVHAFMPLAPISSDKMHTQTLVIQVHDPLRLLGDGQRLCKSFGQFGTSGTERSPSRQNSAVVVLCYEQLFLGWAQSL